VELASVAATRAANFAGRDNVAVLIKVMFEVVQKSIKLQC
jgi:hypothetical protein